MVDIDDQLRLRLAAKGVSTLHRGTFSVPDDCVFEPPCSFKWMGIHHSLYLGAFSYAVSGYYFATKIARYVSIGEDVQIGRGSHPVTWASTSPVLYQDYRAVTDLDWPEANSFRPLSPHQASSYTHIGNDVYIGHGALIMQGVKIGDGAVVGARSVVTKDVPPYAVVAGSPATVRKMRFDDRTVERMLALRWWDYPFWALQDIPVDNPQVFLSMIEEKVSKGLRMFEVDLIVLKDFVNTI